MPFTPEELSPEQLRFVCDPEQFNFETTADLPELSAIIGQDRAVRAIDFGVEIPSYGFNIYAMGPSGTGKTTTVHKFLADKVDREPVPDDWCYVNNFDNPNAPRALRLPAGKGSHFKAEMEELVRDLSRDVPQVFESDDYVARRAALVKEFEQTRNKELQQLEQKANQRSFTLVKTAMGLVLAPVLEGRMITPEQYMQLPEEQRQTFEAHREELQGELDHAIRVVRDLEKAAKEQVRALDQDVAAAAVDRHMDDLREYAGIPDVARYLGEVRQDIIENVGYFKKSGSEEEGQEEPQVPGAVPTELWLKRYQVNVIVDNSETKGAPVVIELNPTYYNLVGRIEQQAQFGTFTTDFTMIRSGCLHRANGGYLVLEVKSVLTHPFAWDALKRAIKNRLIKTEELGEGFRLISTVTLEPELIPLDVKVILLGDAATYYLLYSLDDDFQKLFKVKADFGTDMDRSPEALQSYAQFIASHCRADNLRHFDRGAVARVIEHSSRLVEDQDKLSIRFMDIVDLIQEASYWAGENGRDMVTAEDVQQAINEKVYRANRIEERVRERITKGTIRIDTTGVEVGQVNGLTISQIGDYAFGSPARISAQTYSGKGGVINIEREAKMSGRIHDKGVLILSAYLSGKYAQKKPLNVSASITFEQLYDTVDGDSASSTELYALLSSLSSLPLRQDLAVTGSVDQHGNIQPVGGVSQKIEGFFDLCAARGLTSTQGVIIPTQNVRNLMLREDVAQAVREGKFHVYPISTVDEGIAFLTGREAGELQEDGAYPEGTVHALVNARLEELAKAATEEKQGEAKEEGEAEAGEEQKQGKA
jgi:lon-related putative ATP-dependent protease